MKRALISGLFIIIFLGSCNLFKRGTAKSDPYEGYREEITISGITFEDIEEQRETQAYDFKPGELAVDKQLAQALDNLERTNKQERYYNGYTVLVYSGVDRDQAFKTRNEVYKNFPEIKLDLQYQEPRYLLKVGTYVNRIEAQAAYHKLKEKFPSVRIIQDRFQRNGPEVPVEKQDGER